MIESGKLDEMNEFQFMVFVQKTSKAFLTQRNIPPQERSAVQNAFNQYIIGRIEKDESPIYLHEVADWTQNIYFSRNSQYGRQLETLLR